MSNNLNIVDPDLSDASIQKSVDSQHKLFIAASLMIFQIGFALFEWGSVRKKNSDMVMMRQFLIFCTAAVTTFIFGFAIAYGEPYMMGSKYFLSIGLIGDAQSLASNYILLVLCSSITSNLALSSVSERGGSPSIFLWISFTVIFSTFVFPIITAWTLGNGFLQQLQSITLDEAACLSLHLTSGLSAFVGCFILKSRLGRYQPIPIKQRFKESEEGIQIYLNTSQTQVQQQQIDKLIQNLPVNFEKQSKVICQQIAQIRQMAQKSDSDGFFSRNSIVTCYIGQIMMVTSLAHIASGINISQSTNSLKSNQALINSLVACSGGALGTLSMCRFYKYSEHLTSKLHLQDMKSYRELSYLNQRKKTYFMNIDSEVDLFLICRGMISGMVSVSISPSLYYPVAALLNGFIAGGMYIWSLDVSKSMDLDDTMNVSQVHGLMSMFSLFSICFFHKDEGFLFRDIYTEFASPELGSDIDMNEVAPIILVLGSNSLSTFAVVFITSLFSFLIFRCIFKPFNAWKSVRQRMQDIIGSDTYSLFVQNDRILKNHLSGIINEFYPSENGLMGYFVKQQKQKYMTLPLKAQTQQSFIGSATGLSIKRRELSLKDLLEMKRIVMEQIEIQQMQKEQQEEESSQESFYLSEEEEKEEKTSTLKKKKSLVEEVEMVPQTNVFVHRDTIAEVSRGNTSRSKYNFADDSDSDDDAAMLTRNSEYYRGDEMDLDQKNMRSTMAMGNVLNIDQQKSVKQGEELYLSKMEKLKAEEEEKKAADEAAEAAALEAQHQQDIGYQKYLAQLPGGESIRNNFTYYQQQLPGRETMARNIQQKLPDARDVSIMKHKVQDGFMNLYGQYFTKTPAGPQQPEEAMDLDQDEDKQI